MVSPNLPLRVTLYGISRLAFTALHHAMRSSDV